MRWLVVRGVMGGMVWVGGGGRRCRVWGVVMGFLLAAGGGGTRGGVCRRGHRYQWAAGGCRVLRLWPGLEGGRGGVVWGWHCWWWGGAGGGVVLAGGLGVPVGRVGVTCVRRAVLAVPGWLRCRGVGGRRPHWRPGGAWSVGKGWLPVDGARWYGVWVGGLLVVVGCSY